MYILNAEIEDKKNFRYVKAYVKVARNKTEFF
jgi:hypothetical protein